MALLCNAGVLIGVGDGRQEKGKFSFGSFRVIGETDDDEEWNELIAEHGRAAQIKAFNDPVYSDRDTKDLMEFFEAETERRAA